MTEQAKAKLAEKEGRVRKAIELKEADRVPINVAGNIFSVVEAGYTLAEVIYDTSMEKGKDATLKYLLKYDNDLGAGAPDMAGTGPALDLIAPTYMEWAGRPGTKISDNSIQQFIEFPVLLDEEFEKFFSDRTGWEIQNSMPKLSPLCKPMENLQIPLSHHGGLRDLADAFSTPDMRNMLQTFWKISEMYQQVDKKRAEVAKAVVEAGFPMLGGGKAVVPFDEYSDTLRGTLLSLTDMFEYEDEVQRFIDEFFPQEIARIKALNKDGSKTGKFVHMTLHKGMDTFMSEENYVKFYWRYLREIIETIVDQGMVPNVFCEGRYSTRLKHLREVPKGKVIFKFEDTPLELAKKELGDIACITGAFPNSLLDYGTPEKVRDECKKMLDICAPGGGYIFTTKCSLTAEAKPENVEAMFETVREYGKY